MVDGGFWSGPCVFFRGLGLVDDVDDVFVYSGLWWITVRKRVDKVVNTSR